MLKIIKSPIVLISLMILFASLSRLLTNQLHLWNFTPIAAMALFSGSHFRDKKYAFLVPLIAMLITDAVIGFHSGMLVVYGVLILITFLGFTLRNNVRVLPVLGASVLSSVIFFVITNFSVWIGSTLYPHNLSGLIACFAAGIPFFGNTLAGDLFYCSVLFGGYAFISRRHSVMQIAIKQESDQ
jgi:hypothetical protein